MISAPFPENESKRLQALLDYQILDTPSEKEFDEVVALASQICNTPIALISLVDKDRQWFKAKTGNIEENETGRDIAFCSHVILQDDLFEVPDAQEDNRFHDNPLVKSDTVRFYAGFPLENDEGLNIGTLCVIDKVPRTLNDEQKFALKVLSNQVMNQIELRTKMRELTAQIAATNQAYEAEKKAKGEAHRAAQAKSRFLAHMSHEIRTPLHGIMGMTEILGETNPTQEQQAFISTLKSSGSILLSIINNILDFSKIDSGHMKLSRNPFNLPELISTLVQSFSIEIANKALAFEFEIMANCPTYVIGDALRLRQILNNFMSNALKFTSTGKIRLVLEVTQSTSKEVNIRFSVSDSGTGILPEKQEIIFKEFQQADESISDYYGGTGLGLSIAKQLTELMGGEIGLISPIQLPERGNGGPGTEFWAEIPFEVHSTPSHNEAYYVVTKPSELPKGIKILVAEDNPINQKLIRRYMDKVGIEIEMANNGKEALDLFARFDFDLILTDINMPEMDGMIVTKILRETYQSQVPIIAMTANAFETDKEHYLSIGMNEVLSKPFNQSQLTNLLKQYIKMDLQID